MNCLKFKKIITLYLDGQLEKRPSDFLNKHLKSCPNCQKIYEGYLKSWQFLDKIPDMDISSNFNALFWEKAKLKEKKSFSWEPVFHFPILSPRLAYALVSIMMVMGLTFIFQIKQQRQLDNLAGYFKSEEEIEMVKHFDVLRDLDLVQNLELLEDYEVIESLEEPISI